MTRRVWRFVRYNLFVAIVLCAAVAVQGSFWVWTGGDFLKVRLRTLLVGGTRLEVMPYTSAEIPPAGAPSGFDSAAILHFIACFSISVPLRSE